MEVLVALGAARSAAQLAKAVGMLEDHTVAALAAVRADVRAVHEAPLREGLRRLRQASLADSEDRRAELLEEARSRFEDASARDLDPTAHAVSLLLLCQSWLLLDERALATHVAREALLAADDAYEQAQYAWSTGPMIPLPWRPIPPKPEEAPFRRTAADAVDLAIALNVDLEPLIFWQDADDDWEAPDDFDYQSVLTWIDRDFIKERRQFFDSQGV